MLSKIQRKERNGLNRCALACRNRKRHGERASLARNAGDMNVALVDFHNPLGDSKSQTCSSHLPGTVFFNPVKAVKNALRILWRDADAGVPYLDENHGLLLPCFNRYSEVHLSPWRRVFDRVVHEDVEKLLDSFMIAVHDQNRGHVVMQADVFGLRQWPCGAHQLLDCRDQIKPLNRKSRAIRFRTCEGQQITDHFGHPLYFILHVDQDGL